MSRFVPLLTPTPRPTDAFRRTPRGFRCWAFGPGTGEPRIGAILETGIHGPCCGVRPRSSSGTDSCFARPIFRATHSRRHPIQSSSTQSASRASSTPTLRARQGGPLVSRLCPAAQQLCASADDGIQFAAGRAAVKPACLVRQARGLRRGSEYGSSVQSTTSPAGLSHSGGVLFFFALHPAGSVSELKALRKLTRRLPAFFAGTPYGFPSSQTPPFRSRSLREERERKPQYCPFILICYDAVSLRASALWFDPEPARC